jgi:hypothetical protein
MIDLKSLSICCFIVTRFNLKAGVPTLEETKHEKAGEQNLWVFWVRTWLKLQAQQKLKALRI